MLAPLLPSFPLVVLSVELTPGSNMGWLALLSASDGRRAGSAATAGIGPGLAMIAAASAFGLAQVAQQSQLVFDLSCCAGAVFLLWLAWQAWVGMTRPPWFGCLPARVRRAALTENVKTLIQPCRFTIKRPNQNW